MARFVSVKEVMQEFDKLCDLGMAEDHLLKRVQSSQKNEIRGSAIRFRKNTSMAERSSLLDSAMTEASENSQEYFDSSFQISKDSKQFRCKNPEARLRSFVNNISNLSTKSSADSLSLQIQDQHYTYQNLDIDQGNKLDKLSFVGGKKPMSVPDLDSHKSSSLSDQIKESTFAVRKVYGVGQIPKLSLIPATNSKESSKGIRTMSRDSRRTREIDSTADRESARLHGSNDSRLLADEMSISGHLKNMRQRPPLPKKQAVWLSKPESGERSINCVDEEYGNMSARKENKENMFIIKKIVNNNNSSTSQCKIAQKKLTAPSSSRDEDYAIQKSLGIIENYSDMDDDFFNKYVNERKNKTH